MSKKYENEQAVVLAANIYILRKVVDTMLGKNSQYYKEIFGIRRTTLDNIVAGNLDAGIRWDYKNIAQKMRMDPEIFCGNKIIQIKGDSIKYIEKNYDKLVEELNASKIGKSKLKENKEKNISEYSLWNIILNNREFSKDNDWQKAKTFLLKEVAEQTKEENFEDAQLWKFWNFIRKNYL